MSELLHRLLAVAGCAAVLAMCQTTWLAAMADDVPALGQLAGPQPVEAYVRYALENNPDIQAARQRVAAAGYRIPQAGSLEDPTFEVDTQSPPGDVEVEFSVSQKFPWLGKLNTRADMERWSTIAARARCAAVELSVVEDVKRAYYELYYIEQAIRITQTDRQLLVDFARIAETKYRAGSVSQQDVLRAQLEVANLDNELIRLRQELASTRARLARQLHVSPDTPLGTADALSAEQIPGDLNVLYAQAVAGRPELRAQLAMVGRERRAVDLAGLQYYPDATLSFGWMDMPSDMPNDPYTAGVMVNLPVYRNRLSAGVREAQANLAAEARQYDALKDQTLEEVKDLFVQVQSQQDLLRLFREDIIPKADQTLRVSVQAYQAGQVTFLQLVDNWRELLRFQLTHQRLEAQLRQTLAGLERTVGGYNALRSAIETAEPRVPDPLPELPPAGVAK